MQCYQDKYIGYIETEPFEICVNKIVPYLDAYNGTIGMYTLEFIKSISIRVNNPISGITHNEQTLFIFDINMSRFWSN